MVSSKLMNRTSLDDVELPNQIKEPENLYAFPLKIGLQTKKLSIRKVSSDVFLANSALRQLTLSQN